MQPIVLKSAALAVVAMTAVAFATPAVAQSRRELGERLEAAESLLRDHEARMSIVESRVLSGDPAAIRLLERVDALEQQLLRLNGSLEQSQYENRQLREALLVLRRQMQLAGLSIDSGDGLLDAPVGSGGDLSSSAGPARIDGAPGVLGGEAENRIVAAPPQDSSDPFAGAIEGELGSSRVVRLSEDPGEALAASKGLLIDGRFAEAEEAFAQFVARFGEDYRVGEALFWQGETFFVRGEFGEAANLYIESLSRFPDGDKAPDAMIKLAAALSALGETGEACRTLDAFTSEFPGASSGLRTRAERARDDAGCA